MFLPEIVQPSVICFMDRTEYMKEWRAKNREKVKKNKARWDKENKAAKAAHDKSYYARHTEEIKDKRALYRIARAEFIKTLNKDYRARNKKAIADFKKDWFQRNKLSVAVKRKARFQSDPAFRISCNLRSRIRQAMRINRSFTSSKSASTRELLGCSWEELKAHLESLFLPGMTWGNYSEWHIDHIKPCANFNLVLPAEQALCFHFSNLQPLWAKDNLSKNRY
jgi:hypothetical protein